MVRLSFAGSSFTEHANLHANVMAQLDGVAEQQGVSARYATAPERFGTVHARAGQRVAVCWWTSTTSRSWTRWRRWRWHVPTRHYLRGLYGVIRTATRTSGSRS